MHSVSHKFVVRARANLINFPPSLRWKEPVGMPRANFFKFFVTIWFSELSCADGRRDDDMIDCVASRWQRLFATARLSVSDPALDSESRALKRPSFHRS